jgi:hypothetical protein
MKGKFGASRVSESVALAIALDHLFGVSARPERIEVIGCHTVPVRNGSIPAELEPIFCKQPDRFYVFVLRTSPGNTHVVGMRSNGTIEFVNLIPTANS